jgi:hypothetical protein
MSEGSSAYEAWAASVDDLSLYLDPRDYDDGDDVISQHALTLFLYVCKCSNRDPATVLKSLVVDYIESQGLPEIQALCSVRQLKGASL